jgi:hypothetical protein
MRKITREEAENYFDRFDVFNTDVEQDSSQLRIVILLTDQKVIRIIYDINTHKELFYIDQ